MLSNCMQTGFQAGVASRLHRTYAPHMHWEKTMGATAAPVSDGVSLRAMTADDLAAAHALTDELRWPHRPADWEQAFRHGEGLVTRIEGIPAIGRVLEPR